MLQCVKQLCSRSRGAGQLTRMLPQVQVNLSLQGTTVSVHWAADVCQIRCRPRNAPAGSG